MKKRCIQEYIFNKIKADNSLTIFGSGLNREKSIYAFKSIYFGKEGHTSINFGNNTASFRYPIEYIFKNNCLQCHGYREKVVSKYSLRDMSKLEATFLRKFIYNSEELDYEFSGAVFNHNHTYLREDELDALDHFIKTFEKSNFFEEKDNCVLYGRV